MKTELTLSQDLDQLGFDTMGIEDMKLISGGDGDVYVKFDPITGQFIIITRPKRP